MCLYIKYIWTIICEGFDNVLTVLALTLTKITSEQVSYVSLQEVQQIQIYNKNAHFTNSCYFSVQPQFCLFHKHNSYLTNAICTATHAKLLHGQKQVKTKETEKKSTLNKKKVVKHV